MASPAPSSTLFQLFDEPSAHPAHPGGRERIAGRYEILGLLGSGAMGSVYKVRDVELDEVVALKRIRPELAAVQGALERFRQEVKLARRVSHPNVVRTFDLGEDEQERFLTMEYVQGSSLAEVLATRGALPVPQALSLGLQLGAGLAAAHRAGVLHRDLKPDNVLVTAQGRAIITDFGIARAMVSGGLTDRQMSGTPAYMAPEQVEPGGLIDARSDQYALGAVLFELLTGARAWPGSEPLLVARARLSAPPPDPRLHRPELPPPLAELVLRCMARSPQARFPDLDAVIQALSSLTTDPELPLPALSERPARSPKTDAQALAVLPLTVEAEADGWIAHGLTEELIDALSMTPGLRVRPLSSVRGVDARDPLAAGERLGVRVVVSGSVRRMGDQIRLAIRMMHVGDGYQLWARRATTPPAAALALSDTIADEIARALTVRLQAPLREAEDPVAVELYLKGRAASHRNWHGDLSEAVALLAAARERAPAHPSILAAFATARARQAFYQSTGQAELLDEALAAAQEAVARGPNLGEPWMALANVRFYRMDSPGAYQAVRAALAQAPGIARAHELLGILLLEAGRIDEAEASLRTALSVDPSAHQSRWELARLHALRGEWEASDQALATRLPPHHENTYAEAITRLRLDFWQNRTATVDPTPFQLDTARGQLVTHAIWLLHLLVTEGRVHPDFASYLQGRLPHAQGRQRVLIRQVMVEVASRAGDREQAMAWLAEAIDDGLQDLAWLDRCPPLALTRTHPRWGALRERVAARATRVYEPDPTR